MMVPVEKRAKIVDAYERGEGSLRVLAKRYGVNPKSILDWIALREETGALERRPPCPGRPRVLGPEADEQLRRWRAEDPTLTSEALAVRLKEEMNLVAHPATIRTHFQEMGLRYQRVDAGQDRAPAAKKDEDKETRYQDSHRSVPQPTQRRTPYPSDLTDEEWYRLEPLLRHCLGSRAQPRELDLREIVNAMRYIARTGCQWRYLPHDFPPWPAINTAFNRWKKRGIWTQLNTLLREQARENAGRKRTPTAAIIDSRSVKTAEKGG